MVVDASLLQSVSTLHVVVTMLSVGQEHTASVCDAYSTIAVGSCTFVFLFRVFPFAAAVVAVLRMVTLSL